LSLWISKLEGPTEEWRMHLENTYRYSILSKVPSPDLLPTSHSVNQKISGTTTQVCCAIYKIICRISHKWAVRIVRSLNVTSNVR
jgi:hypothetical protein